ncbi:MAG: Smr/MutS family protein [Desulfobacterales bacterium]
MKPVTVPIEDRIDLHTFHPKDIPDLLSEYFSACIDSGITSVRVIHGKGTGVLKMNVIKNLKKNPLVVCFREAPPDSGGWGATQVTLVSRK